MGTLKTDTSNANALSTTATGDTLVGGLGNDVYTVAHAGVSIVENMNEGLDTVKTSYLDAAGVFSISRFGQVENLTYTGALAARLQGNGLNNAITGGLLNDSIEGGAGNDTLNGSSGDDVLSGGAGDDKLDGGANSTITGGGDTLIGGAGNDLYLVNSPLDTVLEGQDMGFDTIQSTGTVTSLYSAKYNNIEGLTYTGTTAKVLNGNTASNAITSTSATADTLSGGLGDDTLNGGAGNDSMTGGDGSDSYVVNVGDLVFENAGQGSDTLIGTITSLATTATGANFASTVENLVYTSATGATLTGNTLNNRIIGGAGNDTINAGNGDDYLSGGGVNKDSLVGGSGNDRYYIQDDVDVIVEGADSIGGSADWVFGATSIKLSKYANVNNVVLVGDSWFAEGSTASNVMFGNSQENHLVGLAGNDILGGYAMNGDDPSYSAVMMLPMLYHETGDVATDVLEGGDGNDVLIGSWESYGSSYYGAPGGDALLGGTGNDVYIIANEADTIHDTSGTDTVISLLSDLSLEAYEGVENAKMVGAAQPAELTSLVTRLNAAGVAGAVFGSTYDYNYYGLTGNSLNNQLTGNGGDNELKGLTGNDTLFGMGGDDTLVGGTGNDSMVGGDGDDIYEVEGTDVIVETASGGRDAIRSATLTTLGSYANVEGLLYTGTGNVTLTGRDLIGDWIGGGSGNNTINGLSGDDLLEGGAGNDTLNGGVGNDTLSGGLGQDSLLGGDGDDALWVMDDYSNPDSSDGGATYWGNTLKGEAGQDALNGGSGKDTLDGGDDNDSVFGKDGNDSVLGGNGNDYVYGDDSQNSYYNTPPNHGHDTLNGGAGLDQLYGGGGNDSLVGGNDADTLYGDFGYDTSYNPIPSGNDTLNGEAGDDSLYGGKGNDSLQGGSGNDYVYGGSSSYSGDASTGNDTLDGGAGNDYLYGGDGNDLILATGTTLATSPWSVSSDVLSGGGGNDTFRFGQAFGTTLQDAADPASTAYFATGHLVSDFVSGQDRLSILGTMVGDNDTVLDSNATAAAADSTTTFSNTAELVLFTGNYGGYLASSWSMSYFAADAVATAIGDASASFAAGDERLFVINDGTSSAVFQFVSAAADATVSANELKLIGVVYGDASLGASDFALY